MWRCETLLGTYLGATSGLSVMRREVRRGQGRVIHAVIWYSDLRGSTALAERLPLEAYLATLNTSSIASLTRSPGKVASPPGRQRRAG